MAFEPAKLFILSNVYYLLVLPYNLQGNDKEESKWKAKEIRPFRKRKLRKAM